MNLTEAIRVAQATGQTEIKRVSWRGCTLYLEMMVIMNGKNNFSLGWCWAPNIEDLLSYDWVVVEDEDKYVILNGESNGNSDR